MAGARQGLVGLPDCAQAAIADFCGRTGHIMIMSTCSELLRAFAVHVEEVALTNSDRRATQMGRTVHEYPSERTSGLDPATGVPALLRRLPNLRRLHCQTEGGRVGLLGALAQALTAGGGCCARVVELELRGEPPRQEVEALAQAIGMGTLPSLETLVVKYGSEDLLLVCEALRGGASPRLSSLDVASGSEGLMDLRWVLEARMGLGCCPISRFQLWWDDLDYYSPLDDEWCLRQLLVSSTASSQLEYLRAGNCQVCCVSRHTRTHTQTPVDLWVCLLTLMVWQVEAVIKALHELKPQKLAHLHLDGKM
jgi:hypothetical protein